MLLLLALCFPFNVTGVLGIFRAILCCVVLRREEAEEGIVTRPVGCDSHPFAFAGRVGVSATVVSVDEAVAFTASLGGGGGIRNESDDGVGTDADELHDFFSSFEQSVDPEREQPSHSKEGLTEEQNEPERFLPRITQYGQKIADEDIYAHFVPEGHVVGQAECLTEALGTGADQPTSFGMFAEDLLQLSVPALPGGDVAANGVDFAFPARAR